MINPCAKGKNMASTATLSSKFQISVPKIVREELHWEAGQEFVFIPKGKGVLLMPVPELEQLAGLVKGVNAEGYRDRQDRF
jgi:AbrB family looped-hinge helix DNA binding protein